MIGQPEPCTPQWTGRAITKSIVAAPDAHANGGLEFPRVAWRIPRPLPYPDPGGSRNGVKRRPGWVNTGGLVGRMVRCFPALFEGALGLLGAVWDLLVLTVALGTSYLV